MAMTQSEALQSFIEKWRARWPEWNIAEVFVPASQRDIAVAWLALLQELTDAAWHGDDPTPGLAKLAWWQEELQGWSQGRRRHPLGATLQSRPAPWMTLSNALSALQNLRILPREMGDGFTGLRSFTEGVAAIEAMLFDENTPDENIPDEHPSPASDLIAASLMAMHPALRGSANDFLRATLLSRWPVSRGPHTRRIISALARARLAGAASHPIPQWRTLWIAWRAAGR